MTHSLTPLFSQYEKWYYCSVFCALLVVYYKSQLKFSPDIPKEILQKKIVFGSTTTSSL
jgi:hypothetical protein